MDYDEAGVEMQFKSAAAISVTYTLLERCGFEPAGWFDKDDFQAMVGTPCSPTRWVPAKVLRWQLRQWNLSVWACVRKACSWYPTI